MAWSNTPSRTQLLQSATKAASELTAAMTIAHQLTPEAGKLAFEGFRQEIFDFAIAELEKELAMAAEAAPARTTTPEGDFSGDPEEFELKSGAHKGKTLKSIAASGEKGVGYIRWYATSGKGPNKTVVAACKAYLEKKGL